MKSLPILLIGLIVSGCTTFTPPATYHSLNDGTYWMSYDASRRGAFFKVKGDKIRTCSEQAPDVALSLANTVKANATSGTVTGGIDTSFAATALALAGRDDIVLLAREALFRVCEQNLNQVIPDNQVLDAMNQMLAHIEKIAETKNATVKSQTEKLQQLQNFSPQQLQQLQQLQ